MNNWGKYFLATALLVPFGCLAVQPYTPTTTDPVLEPWRWRQEKALEELHVLNMDEAADGTLWFGNVGSIAHYDGINITRIPFDHALLSKIVHRNNPTPWCRDLLLLDNGKPLILVGQSLVLWNDGEWQVILKDAGWALENFIERLFQREDGSVWLMAPTGLWRLSKDLTTSELVISGSHEYSLRSFCFDERGDAWIIQETGNDVAKLVRIPIQNGRAVSTKKWQKYPIPQYRSNNEVRILSDDQGSIWYAASGSENNFQMFNVKIEQWITPENVEINSGLFCLIKSRNGDLWMGGPGPLHTLHNDQHSFYSTDQLGLPRVPLSLFESSDGRFWVIGRISTVYSVDMGSQQWLTYSGLNFQCESSGGIQWFATQNRGEVVSHNPTTGAWLKYGPEDQMIDRVETLVSSSHDLVWATGSHAGRAAIAVFDGQQWSRYCHPDFAQWIDSDAVFESADKTMWFGAGGQLLNEVPHAGGALQYGVDASGKVTFLKHHAPPDFPYFITVFGQSADRTLWIGGSILHQYDTETGRATPNTQLPWEATKDIVLDRNQNLWISKCNFGVFQQQGEQWHNFTPKDGLVSQRISDLLVLDDGSILAASDKGVSRFDGQVWVEQVFPEWLGMANRRGGLRQSTDGSIWFDFVSEELRPVDILMKNTEPYCTVRYRPETNAPNTIITHFLKRVAPLGNSLISWEGQDTGGRTTQDELQFSWRLNQEAWSPFSYETSRSFLNMDRGTYSLEVRARDLEFNIDPTPAFIEFEVIPPVWQQIWFLSLVVLFSSTIAFLIWVIVWNRERHLRELNRLKTNFFTNVSHELRTPITVILLPLEQMLVNEQDEKKRKTLLMMVRNAHRVATLITQLLDFRRIEQGSTRPEITQGDLASFVRELVDSLQPLAENARIECQVEGVNSCVGWFDADKFKKIVTNLISNSIKYTPAGGTVRVVLEEKHDPKGLRKLNVVVEDDGVGIAPKYLPHLFDRFYRVPESSIVDGSGIGLNLTKELVELLGGEISAESPIHQNVDRPGTRFIASIPIDRSAFSAEEVKEHKDSVIISDTTLPVVENTEEVVPEYTASLGIDVPLVLIVEDDNDIREFVADGLESNYRVEMAKDGKIGLKKAKDTIPDLIVTDLMMPEMGGIELCRELKNAVETSHIPVIMLTAKTSLESQLEGLQTGADDYITKPFHMILLQTRIQNLLESRRLLRERFCKEFPVFDLEIPENMMDSAFLNQAVRAAEENCSDWNFRSDQFAAALNMSPRSLQRKLKAIIGQTPSSFITEVRLKLATKLMVQTDQTITEIAFSVGFDESSNFSRTFKKQYKLSPSQYRSTHRPS